MSRAVTDAFCVTLVVLAAQDAECRSTSMPSPAGNRPSKIYMAVADESATAQQPRETSTARSATRTRSTLVLARADSAV